MAIMFDMIYNSDILKNATKTVYSRLFSEMHFTFKPYVNDIQSIPNSLQLHSLFELVWPKGRNSHFSACISYYYDN